MPEFTYEIVESVAVLSENPKGWTKELNLISWNGRDPKYDIREWAPDHEKMGKGVTLSKEEMAFYDALTRPRAVQDFYSNDQLVEMTKELTEALRKNRTIDWQKKESARAGMRRLIKRLLKKYKYPPEEEQNALDIVLKQCEQWADVEPEYVYDE